MKNLTYALLLICASCMADARASYMPPPGPLRTLSPSAGTQTIDLTLADIYKLDLENSSATVTVTLSGAPTSKPATYAFIVQQSTANPNRTITITGAKWPGGVTPVITAVADAIDTIYCVWSGATMYCDQGADYR